MSIFGYGQYRGTAHGYVVQLNVENMEKGEWMSRGKCDTIPEWMEEGKGFCSTSKL